MAEKKILCVEAMKGYCPNVELKAFTDCSVIRKDDAGYYLCSIIGDKEKEFGCSLIEKLNLLGKIAGK